MVSIRVAHAVEQCIRYQLNPWRDRLYNWRHATAPERLLIVRHPTFFSRYYGQWLRWLACQFPELHSRCELRTLPCRIGDWSPYVLQVPWVLDSLLVPSRWEHAAIRRVEAGCRAAGIPMINPSEVALGTAKSLVAEKLAGIGIRTPRMAVIQDVERFREDLNGLSLPLLIRPDHSHAGHMPIHRVQRLADIDTLPLAQMDHPVAIEYIDVQSEDGLYRRYRYLAAGDTGIAANVHVSQRWEVRGKYRITSDATRAEELAFVSRPDTNHQLLQQARRVLGLDFVGFDYSYDRQGQLVVWEANAVPGVHYSSDPRRQYMAPVVERIFAAMTRLYLERARLPVPDRLGELVEAWPPDWHVARRAA